MLNLETLILFGRKAGMRDSDAGVSGVVGVLRAAA